MTRVLHALLMASLLAGPLAAADSFDDLLRTVGADAAKAYVQPLADAATITAGSGLFHNGRSKGLVGLDVGVKLVMLPFSTGDTPEGSILDDQVGSDVSAIGLPMLTASKGLIKGLQVSARITQLELSKEVGSLGLLGASLRYELSEVLPLSLLMPRIALQADWTRLSLGDALETTVTSFDLVASKSFVILEPYVGLSLLTGKTDLSYTAGTGALTEEVSLELDTDATKLVAGVNVTPFPMLKVNAEYSLSDYHTMTVGLLFNLF